jgi:putative membrane protein
MMDWGYGMGGNGWLLMTGFWVVLVALLVGVAMWIFPRQPRPDSVGRDRSSVTAREVLDQRLARGELDVETYRVLRDELARPRTQPL